jgi:hypothetical protein
MKEGLVFSSEKRSQSNPFQYFINANANRRACFSFDLQGRIVRVKARRL